MTEHEYEAIVLGGGPAGYPCAIRLGQLGVKAVCVEEEEYGGVCLNWGCIPSKALISNAHFYTKAKHVAPHGLVFGSIGLDVEKMQDWKQGIVKKLTGGVRQLLKANGADIVEGRGRFVDARTVEVEKPSGERARLRASKAVIVATGSATIQVPGFDFDGERIIGAREAVSLRQIPKRLLVIGGGVIGMELGMVYQAFGSQLTIVELTPTLLPGIDPECVKVVERIVTKRGAKLYKGARAESWQKRGDALAVELVASEQRMEVECDVVLVAVGMKPRSRGIGLDELGVKVDQRGFIATDEFCRTNVDGVYAIGDVSGPPMLAHKATKEGEVCAEVIAGKPAAKDWASVANIIFTEPEIASVGLSEAQAKEQGLDVRIGRFPFAALGRAMSIAETDGFVKVLSDRASGRVVGVHICGPNASDLISEAALALEMVATLDDIAMTIHPHPTLGEALMEASAAALGHAIHIVNR
jgi:dihydrolipoamide dehydrogenase